MIVQCPKCGSKNTYEIGRDCGCRMCGKQFPKEGAAPIVLTKVFNERKKDMQEEIKKYPSGKKGVCSNCGKSRFIADKDGRCSTCSRVAKRNKAVETPPSGTTQIVPGHDHRRGRPYWQDTDHRDDASRTRYAHIRSG